MEKKYSIIYDALLRRIKRGTYPEENMIPTERELTQEFSVTRNTVRRAIEELINEGYLYRKPGSGAFVCA
jgi:DNA-binding GntR family transcriptional regulator